MSANFLPPSPDQHAVVLSSCRTTVQDVQVRTGLDFFWALPDPLENRLENEQAEYWLEN